jgi:hypothetical protein
MTSCDMLPRLCNMHKLCNLQNAISAKEEVTYSQTWSHVLSDFSVSLQWHKFKTCKCSTGEGTMVCVSHPHWYAKICHIGSPGTLMTCD